MTMRVSLCIGTSALLLCACSVWEKGETVSAPERIIFTVPALPLVEEEAATRVALLSDGTTRRFEWETADTVGIFPDAGSQVFFPMTSGAGSDAASFDGGAWSLRESAVYYSYFPFVGDMYLSADRIPVSFGSQCQRGTSALEKGRFYLASSGTTSETGALRFSYRMLNAILRFDVTLPAGTYTDATLSAEEPLFVKSGSYDLADPAITGTRYAKSLDLSLENFTVTGSSAVPVYFSLAPSDLTGKTLTLEIRSSEGRRYTCQATPSRRYEAGTCYHFTRPMTPAVTAQTWMRTNVWPVDGQGNPDVSQIPEYSPSQSIPYLQWYARPSAPNGTVALLLGGEDYDSAPNEALLDEWAATLTAQGVLCVALFYRTPRGSIHFCRSAWQDGQRALRVIRNAVALDPTFQAYDPNRIGVVGWSAGAHLGMMLATCSSVPAYNPVDVYEAANIACNVNWAILDGTAYATTEEALDPLFAFDANTPSICLLHGQDDPYTPLASTLIYRELRKRGRPSEVHLYPGKGHEPKRLDRAVEYLRQMGFLGTLGAEQDVEVRFASDADRARYIREDVWPSGRIPNYASNQITPYLEWHFPVNRTTDAVQIIYSGGAYQGSSPDNLEVAPIRRYLNAKGITVVTLCYRYKLPVGRLDGLPKHLGPWQDLQRTIRKVRSEASQYGLDPERIGIMGFSAGGHLTLMGATSSRHPSYAPVDAIDALSCKPRWAVAFYPAYTLTDDDGLTSGNAHGGNLDTDVLVPEFSFDLDTAPMLLLHGDADAFASMASVKVWEKLRSMGIPAECHTLATRGHCFQWKSSPGTGSYHCFDRVWEYLEPWMY